MEGIYGWIKNIVYYLIFMTMLMNLLPAGKYEKYLKLFSGCVLILLVLKPLTGGLRLEEQITALFNSFSFENDVGEFRAELEGMEGKRLSVLVERYEETAAGDIRRLAAMEGLTAREVSVEIAGDKDSPDFGQIKGVTVVLDASGEEDAGPKYGGKEYDGKEYDGKKYAGQDSRETAGERSEAQWEDGGNGEPARKVDLVDPVKIQVELKDGGESPPPSRGETAGEGQTAAGQNVAGQTAAGQNVAGQTAAGQNIAGQTATGQTPEGQTAAGQTVAEQVRVGMPAPAKKLRQAIAGCYQVEERYVEIKLENE